MPRTQTSVRRSRLALGVALIGCSLASTSESHAAIVSLDLGPSGFNILGVNAGMTFNQSTRVINNFVPGNDLRIDFGDNFGAGTNYIGFHTNSPSFQISRDPGFASPHNFASGADISAWAGWWSSQSVHTSFFVGPNPYIGSFVSPNFGPGSFLGFRFGSAGNWNYGWLEVTWNWTGNAQTSTFEIIAAAYESDANTAILAGATGGGAVPLPGAAGLAACGLLGLSRRRRR